MEREQIISKQAQESRKLKSNMPLLIVFKTSKHHLCTRQKLQFLLLELFLHIIFDFCLFSGFEYF